MKRISSISLVALCLLLSISSIFSQTKLDSEIDTDTFNGVWLFKGQQMDNAPFVSSKIPIYKIILNGAFINLMAPRPEHIISAYGDFYVESDSVLHEKIRFSINEKHNGKNNVINYRMVDRKYLYVKFQIIEPANKKPSIWYEELWEKIDFPKVSQSVAVTDKKNTAN